MSVLCSADSQARRAREAEAAITHQAAITLQSAHRCNAQRRYFLKLKRSAVCVQALVREAIARPPTR